MTYLAFSICELGWPLIILSWLLPFLCGLLLGWAIWARFKKQVEKLEGDIIDLKTQISGLEEELVACRHARTELNGELSSVKGQLREKNLQISTLESSLAASSKDTSSKSKGSSKSGTSETGSGKKGGKGKESSKKSANDKGSKTSDSKDEAAKDAGISSSSSLTDDSGVAGTIAKGALAGTIVSSLGADNDSSAKAGGSDDLKKIEGVGPKIAGLLNEAGINSYGELAESDTSALQKILNDAGPRYKIANPTTWAQQAALARDGKWDELKKLQDSIEGGVIGSGAISSKKDDLKKVEGIGPKIESLLNADGLHSFADLASAGIERIQKVLDDAGPRYRIANPSTWADQAGLARDGKWDALKALQDSLKGGRK